MERVIHILSALHHDSETFDIAVSSGVTFSQLMQGSTQSDVISILTRALRTITKDSLFPSYFWIVVIRSTRIQSWRRIYVFSYRYIRQNVGSEELAYQVKLSKLIRTAFGIIG